MTIIFKLIRLIVKSFFLIYTFNVITNRIGFYIPINIYSIALITVLDFPGLVLLIILKQIL